MCDSGRTLSTHPETLLVENTTCPPDPWHVEWQAVPPQSDKLKSNIFGSGVATGVQGSAPRLGAASPAYIYRLEEAIVNNIHEDTPIDTKDVEVSGHSSASVTWFTAFISW